MFISSLKYNMSISSLIYNMPISSLKYNMSISSLKYNLQYDLVLLQQTNVDDLDGSLYKEEG